MKIEQYTENDYQDMRDFYFHILCETSFFRPYSYDLKELNEPERKSFIIRDNGKIIAHLTLSANPTKEDKPIEYTIGKAILRDYWSKGIGRKLTRFAFNYVKSAGGIRIYSNMNMKNWRSILLNFNMGYDLCGESSEEITFVKSL